MALLRGFSVFFAILQITGAAFYLGKIGFGYAQLNTHEGLDENVVLPIAITIYIKIIIAACLLLKGIFSQRPGFFLYWIIYNGILVSFCTMIMMHLIGSNKTYLLEKNGTTLTQYILFIVLYWIKWIVIYGHYKQVQLERNVGDVVNPYSKFDNENILPVMKA